MQATVIHSFVKCRTWALRKLQWHCRDATCWKLVGANEVQMTASNDSSAASGIMQRAGQGKLKHIHIRIFLIQDLVREKIVRLLRVPTAINPADLNTKKLSQKRDERS